MSNTFFVAILLFKSSSDSKEYEPLYEETTVLIQAPDAQNATDKAHVLAKSRETTFQNGLGQSVTWQLVKIIDVNPMLESSIQDVTEVYARHFKDIEAYKAFETLANK